MSFLTVLYEPILSDCRIAHMTYTYTKYTYTIHILNIQKYYIHIGILNIHIYCITYTYTKYTCGKTNILRLNYVTLVMTGFPKFLPSKKCAVLIFQNLNFERCCMTNDCQLKDLRRRQQWRRELKEV